MKNISILMIAFLLCIHFVDAAPMGEELDIEVQLLMTGQFTLQSWNDPNINLWTVSLTNKTDDVMYVNVEFRLSVQNVSGISESDNPVAWGVTDPYEVQPNSTILLMNSSFTEDRMMVFEITKKFQDMIETNGYLPAGKYDIKMIAWENVTRADTDRDSRLVMDTDENRLLDLSWDHSFVDKRYDRNWTWDKPEAQMPGENLTNILSSKIVLNEPVQRADVTDFQPWFRWDSPGFRPGVVIDYRLKVAQYNPEIHSSYDDAFEDVTAVFLDTRWEESYTSIFRVPETGTVRTVSLQYPSSERELACGYEYVWQVEAREYIDGYDYIGQKGIWGWPDPITSPVYIFSYGKRITQDRMSSPAYGATVNSVNPIFNWDLTACAQEYEIWLSEADVDPMVENPWWQSDPIQSLPYTYPLEEEPLVPGKRYVWKIRMNPGPDPSPWSDISTFTVSPIQLTEPITGDEVFTVLPTFNADVPAAVPYYELRISDINDQTVDIGNVLNTVIQTLPYKLRMDENGWLYPGKQYFWKLIPLDANETMLGLPDDHTVIGNFKILNISLQSPANGENQAETNPVFSWEAPAGQDLFEFHLSYADDPNVENPFFTTVLRQKMYQYPSDSEVPLLPGETYYWEVIPLNPDEVAGGPSVTYSFSVKTLDFPVVDWSLTNRDLTAFWSPYASARGYEILISDMPDIREDGRLIQPLWNSDMLLETSLRLPVNELQITPEMILYGQIGVTLDGNTFFWDVPRPLNLNFFNEVDLFIRLSRNPQNPLQPLVELIQGVSGVDEYMITLSSDAGGEEVIMDFFTPGFPFPLEDVWNQIAGYDQVYVNVQALSSGNIIASTNEPIVINPAAFVSVLYEPFLIEPDPAGNPGFMVRYTQPVPFARAVMVNAGTDPELSTPIFSEEYSTNALPVFVTDDFFEYGQQMYVQLVLLRDGMPLGNGSGVYEVILPSRPGANQQVGIVANWLRDQNQMMVERTNSVAGADTYRLTAYSDAEGMDEIWRLDAMTGMTATIDRGELGLPFDSNVYFQITPLANDEIHGIPSEIRRVYIEPVVPPVLSESLLMWDPAIPPAPQYEVRLSTDPDFRSQVIETVVSQNLITEDQFDLYWGTLYFWQVRGVDYDDEPWGAWSNVKSYRSSPGPDIQLESPRSETSLINLPTFSWSCPENLTFVLEISEDESFQSFLYARETSEKQVSYDGETGIFQLNKPYYWRVRGIHPVKGVVISPVFSFAFQELPAISGNEEETLHFVTPANQGIYPVNRLRLAWSGEPEGSVRYEISFSYDDGFSDARTERVEAKEFQPSAPGYFEERRDIFARVRALDEGNNPLTDWSNVLTFQVVSNMTPTLESPANGEKVYSSAIVFSWSNVRYADRYEIMVAEDEEFTSLIWNHDRVTEANISLPEAVGRELKYDHNCFWRVRSLISSANAFPWSAPFQFTLSGDRITTLEYPLDELFEPGNISFSWKRPAGVSHAIVQISTSSDFTSVLFESPPLSANQFSYPAEAPVPLNPSMDYFCRVISSDEEGNHLADPSQTGKFRIKGQVIEIELIFSAAEGGE
ncbi:MAG: hypothetical protein J7K63_02090 [Candidatus Marinimicrobia bacterium]|nr:hypothetical protein [Candidatus Neomarinimicrobiota bacterium]